MFSTVQDPDYAGHVILEQFQAQVTSSIIKEIRCAFLAFEIPSNSIAPM
jgi:hypothetical protein